MRLISQKQFKDVEEEQITLQPEEPEDMWHAYNLIVVGDRVRGHAVRKVTLVNNGTGAATSERVHVDLTIKVKSIFFDPAVSSLRVSGTVASENEWVPLGSHHTLDLEVDRPFTLIKAHGWDTVGRDALAQALGDDRNRATATIVMQQGLANICLITEFRTIFKARVDHVVPRKRDSAATQDAGIKKFFEKTLATLIRSIDFTNPRPLLLASPGFVAADFKEFIAQQGRDKSDKQLTSVAKLAIVIHSNSGHMHSLREVLKSPQVLAKMRDMNFAKEARLMDDFFDLVKRDDGRAWYGSHAVTKAIAEGAVGPGGGLLLINNSLFRSNDLTVRKKYVALVDKVKMDGGDTRVLSSDHESGQRLRMLGDIAAILNYPMQDLDEEEEQGVQQKAADTRQHQEDDISMLDSVI